MKITNVKEYTSPFQWALFLSYEIVKADGLKIKKIYERSKATEYKVEVMTETVE